MTATNKGDDTPAKDLSWIGEPYPYPPDRPDRGIVARHIVKAISSIDSWDVLLVLGVGMLFAGLLLVFGVGYAFIGCGSLFVVGGLMGARGKQLAATNDSEVS